MSNKNDGKRKIKKKDQDEFDQYYKKIKRDEKLLKIASFLPLVFYCIVYILQPYLNDQNEILSYIFTIFSCLFTFSFEIVEWYKLKAKAKVNSFFDSLVRNLSFPFVLTGLLFILFIIIYVNILDGKFYCLKNLDINTDKISSFVLLLYVCSSFTRNIICGTKITDEMIVRFYNIKRRKKRKRSKRNKANLKKKSQKYKIYNEYNNCNVYFSKKE